MFGLFSKKDLERLLAAAGTSLGTVLQDANNNSQRTVSQSAIAIEKNRQIIEKAQLEIAQDTATMNEAAAVTRLVKSLGG